MLLASADTCVYIFIYIIENKTKQIVIEPNSKIDYSMNWMYCFLSWNELTSHLIFTVSCSIPFLCQQGILMGELQLFHPVAIPAGHPHVRVAIASVRGRSISFAGCSQWKHDRRAILSYHFVLPYERRRRLRRTERFLTPMEGYGIIKVRCAYSGTCL